MGKRIQSLKDYVKRTAPKWLYPYIRSVYMIYYKIRWGIRDVIRKHYYLPKIKKYYSDSDKADAEIWSIIKIIKKHGMIPFPYEWAVEAQANSKSVEVFLDEEKGLHYVLLDEKRLYFPRNWTQESIRNSFYSLQYVEQNEKSPHRYLTPDFNVNSDDITADCGAAEANFSLSVIDKVKKAYIFEPGDEWIEPLNATFEPWKDKTVIIQKFVSDTPDEFTVTLDGFFEGKEKPTFLKMDVEGFEKKVLMGGEKLLSDSLKKAVICTYHYHDDEAEIGEIMRSHNFTANPSEGYMLFSMYDELKPPYFRRGVLRCVKQ
ncbi:MAG TPA: FkbM family methyltransferase [Methanocorpusculum sp.]|nr:FkbM family methyltransferase [Methanocorpusculum sp.]